MDPSLRKSSLILSASIENYSSVDSLLISITIDLSLLYDAVEISKLSQCTPK